MRPTIGHSLCGAIAAGCLAGGAAAAPMANAPVVRDLLTCRSVTEDSARLACYDKAAAVMEKATASGDLVAIDRAQRRAASRQAFGFALPTLAFLDRGEKTSETNHIIATVASAGQNSLGDWVLRLDSGAVWAQTEPISLGRDPRAGSKVNISKGMLGSFFLTVDGQGAGKARRLQ